MTGPHRRAVLGGAAAALTAGPAAARPRGLVLERPMLDGVLTMRAEPRFAGAVSSLRFRGMEYVDAADHGRLFQSAIHFDGLGECLNPTQGGASSDGRRSTSRLLAAQAAAEGWAVATRMAYWLRPGQTCDLPGRRAAKAANRGRLSNVTVEVSHRFDALPAPNAVRSEVRYITAETHQSAVAEALTIYTPPAFSRLHVWAGGRFMPAEPAAEHARPYALATADGAHAVALFSPRGAEPARFGGFSYGTVGKLNAVFRPNGPYAPGGHAYALAWALGTLAEVAGALAACT